LFDITSILKDEEGVAEEVIQDAVQLLKQRQQRRLAQCADRLKMCHRAGGGERKNFKDGYSRAMIDPASYHYWGQRLGYDCWDDEQFMREYLRDNPLARVKNISSRIQVGYTPTKKKFSKKYGDAA